VRFDNVSLAAVPEPTTMALAISAALFLMFRLRPLLGKQRESGKLIVRKKLENSRLYAPKV